MNKPFEHEIAVSLDLVKLAVSATEKVRWGGIAAVRKEDGSPLTQADIVSQAIILRGIRRAFPHDRILAEEEFLSAKEGRLVGPAVEVLEKAGISATSSRLEEWVNYRGEAGGERVWMIDPIDGTKGFKRGLCYAVVMGLYFDGRPRFGCMAVPRFPDCVGSEGSVAVAYAGAGIGAYLMEGDEPRRIHVSRTDRLSDFRMVGSRAHDRGGLGRRFMERAGIREMMPMDGEGKYLMVASGRADLLLRGVDTDHGIGFPWDHCGGQVILEEAGGRVTTTTGNPLNYEQPPGAPIADLKGLVASNGACHQEILDLLQEIL